MWSAAAAYEMRGRRAARLHALVRTELAKDAFLPPPPAPPSANAFVQGSTLAAPDELASLRHAMGQLEQYECACTAVRTATDASDAEPHLKERRRLCTALPSMIEAAIAHMGGVVITQGERHAHLTSACTLGLLREVAEDVSAEEQALAGKRGESEGSRVEAGESEPWDEAGGILEAVSQGSSDEVDAADVNAAIRLLEDALAGFEQHHYVGALDTDIGASTMSVKSRQTLQRLRTLSDEHAAMLTHLLSGDKAAVEVTAAYGARDMERMRLEQRFGAQLGAAQEARAGMWRAARRYLSLQAAWALGRGVLTVSSAGGATLLVTDAQEVICTGKCMSVEGGKLIAQMLRTKLLELRRTPEMERMATSLLHKLTRCERSVMKLAAKIRHYENRRSELVEFSHLSSGASDSDPEDSISDDEFSMYAVEDLNQKLAALCAQRSERVEHASQMRAQLQKLVLILPELRFNPKITNVEGGKLVDWNMSTSFSSAGTPTSYSSIADTPTKAQLRVKQRELEAERSQLDVHLENLQIESRQKICDSASEALE